MRDTLNATGFAACYLEASVALMDAIAMPTESAFRNALNLAKDAKVNAYRPRGTSLTAAGGEFDLADLLCKTIIRAADHCGYRR